MVGVVVGGGGEVVGGVVVGGEVVGVVADVGVVTGAEVVGVAEAEPDAAPEPERSLAGVATSRVAEPPAFDASITVAFCGTPAVVVVVPVASGAVVGDVVGAGTLFEATVADGDTSRMTWGGSLGVEPPGATKTRMASSAPTAARPPSMPLRCEGAGGWLEGSANSSWIGRSAARGGVAPGAGSVNSSFIVSPVPPALASPG